MIGNIRFLLMAEVLMINAAKCAVTMEITVFVILVCLGQL